MGLGSQKLGSHNLPDIFENKTDGFLPGEKATIALAIPSTKLW